MIIPNLTKHLLLFITVPSTIPTITNPLVVHGFGGFKIPNPFAPPPSLTSTTTANNNPLLTKKKSELLDAISFTANGKNASPEKQAEVLTIIKSIETMSPPSDDLLTNDEKAMALLDGVWYLQWTSPSNIDVTTVDDDDALYSSTSTDTNNSSSSPLSYNPPNPSDNDQVETKQFTAKGTIVAAGVVTFDTSNKEVKQIFDISQSTVTNEIGLGSWGRLSVSGTFRPSSSADIPLRAVVSFDKLRVELLAVEGGVVLNFDFLFGAIKKLKGRDVGGWLETTFVSEDVRIGRGNKGTCFVLTRDYGAVRP